MLMYTYSEGISHGLWRTFVLLRTDVHYIYMRKTIVSIPPLVQVITERINLSAGVI